MCELDLGKTIHMYDLGKMLQMYDLDLSKLLQMYNLYNGKLQMYDLDIGKIYYKCMTLTLVSCYKYMTLTLVRCTLDQCGHPEECPRLRPRPRVEMATWTTSTVSDRQAWPGQGKEAG